MAGKCPPTASKVLSLTLTGYGVWTSGVDVL
jgi:hypothetical protein